MRIQSVVLENHRNVAVLRLDVIHDFAVDHKCAAGDVFKAGYHTKGCGLSAAGRADENDEFLVSDLKVEILNSFVSVRVSFIDVLK